MNNTGKIIIGIVTIIGIILCNSESIYRKIENNIYASSKEYNFYAYESGDDYGCDVLEDDEAEYLFDQGYCDYETTSLYINEYILPDTNSRYYSEYELEGMSLQAVNYAKNEIYARHGRMFKSVELNEYFDVTSWYYGYIRPDEFSESVFNAFEKENVRLLASLEMKLSSNGYRLDQAGYDYSDIIDRYWYKEYQNDYCYSNMYETGAETLIGELDVVDNQTNCSCFDHMGNTLCIDTYQSDNYGNYYEHSFYAAKGSVTLLNDYEYAEFSGIVATPSGVYSTSFEGYASLYVYGDDELIYFFEKINNTSDPEAFCIDVSEYRQIRLEWICGSDDIVTGVFTDWGEFATIFDGKFMI